MGRILAMDYGSKRTGLAVTDPLRIIAGPLDTVPSTSLLGYLESYLAREKVDEFVIGLPRRLDNSESEMAPMVRKFASVLEAKFPGVPLRFYDERFTTSIARQALLEGGMKKKDRSRKGVADKVSAVILLQDYMTSLNTGR